MVKAEDEGVRSRGRKLARQATTADTTEDAEHGPDQRGDETSDWMANKQQRLYHIRAPSVAIPPAAQAEPWATPPAPLLKPRQKLPPLRVVDNDGVAAADRGRQHLLDAGLEGDVDRPIEHHGRGHAVHPMKVVIFQSPCGSAARQRSACRARPRSRAILVETLGFVDEDQALRIKVRMGCKPSPAPCCYVGPFLLGRRTLFLKVIPWRSRQRQTVLAERSAVLGTP